MSDAAVAEAPTKSEPEARKIPVLAYGQLELWEHRNTRHKAVLPAGVTLEDLHDPAFMSQVLSVVNRSVSAIRVRRYDEIVVVGAEDAFWARLLVMDIGLGWCDVEVLEERRGRPKRGLSFQQVPIGYRIDRDTRTEQFTAAFDRKGEWIDLGMYRTEEEARTRCIEHAAWK